MVGQRINLSASPVGGVLTSPQWSIGGSKIKNYTQTDGQVGPPEVRPKAEVTQLANADLQSVNIGFYFTDGSLAGADITVSISAKVDGISAKAKAKLKVFRPQRNSFTSQWTTENPPWYPRANNLRLGSLTGSPGITWTASVTAPANGAGEIAYTQRVNAARTLQLDNGTIRTVNSGGQYILDDGLGTQYNGVDTLGGSATQTLIRDDSPGNPLIGYKYTSIDDQFELYLMYRPAGVDSIWVSLGKLNWSGSASATKGIFTGEWSVSPGASPGAGGTGPTGSNSTEPPTWDDSTNALIARSGF